MPSEAYKEYSQNLTDVGRLILAHTKENAANPGRRGLGHYTRGGLLLLCAAWERYVESVIEEAARFLTSRLPNVASLPPNAQQKTRDHANNNNTPWTAADLATDRWKEVFLEALKKRTDALNTPKHANLVPLFNTFLDVPDIAAAWTSGHGLIDDFVARRGEVAHRGRQSAYVRIGHLKDVKDLILGYVTETDNFLSDHVRLLVTPNRRPWNRIL